MVFNAKDRLVALKDKFKNLRYNLGILCSGDALSHLHDGCDKAEWCHQRVDSLERAIKRCSPLLWSEPAALLLPPLPPAKELLGWQTLQPRDVGGFPEESLALLGVSPQTQLLGSLTQEEVFRYVDADHYPIPATWDREGYWGERHFVYWLMGLGDYLLMKRICLEHAMLFEGPLGILDLGCASGRVLRHFAVNEPHLTLYGADINRNNVGWIRNYLPGSIRVFQNSVLPYLPLADNSLDFIMGFSVFTHISDYEEAWLLELFRILKPGGMAFFTIHSERTWKQLTESHFMYQYIVNEPHRAEWREKVVNENIGDLFINNMPSDKVCFIATNYSVNNVNVFHSLDYIKKEWSRFFEVVEILDNAHGGHQDGVLLRKGR
jgi:SAM-dependent methyltransferase